MKKLTSLLSLLLAFAILFSACAGKTNENNTEAVSTSAETQTDEALVIFENGEYNFTLIRPDEASKTIKNAVSALYAKLGLMLGSKIDIKTDSKATEKDGYEILVGLTDREESISAANEIPEGQYVVRVIGKKIVLLGCDDRATSDAVNDFIEAYLSEKSDKLTVEDNICRYADRVSSPVLLDDEADADLNGLTLKSEKTVELAEGITYRENTYTDKDGLPVVAYIAEIAKGAGILYTGTPDDGTELRNNGGTVKNEMKAAVANGKNVILGVNAGFFNIESNYCPQGICVKEGEKLSNTNDRPFFAVLKDGSAKVLEASEYKEYKGEIQTAVAGKGLMLRDGEVYDVFLGDDFGSTRHPRTGVGIKPDGTIVIIVVDGRQPEISNGASLADFALMFKELGCTDALNLDGGGSSTFVIRDTEKDTYSIKNSPSDGHERTIQDSLLVLLPD